MTWTIVKNGTAEPKMKHIKKVSRDYQFEDDAMTQFESIRCGFFHFENDMRYSSSPDALRPLGI